MIVKILEIFIYSFSVPIDLTIIRLLKLGGGAGQINAPTIAAPLAISFITFQNISYLIDVYKNKIKEEKNIINYFLYILLFVKLTQGPIMKFSLMESQIINREHSLSKFANGLQRYCYGLGKKIIIANTVGVVADAAFSYDIKYTGTLVAWLGIIAYTIQIYYDFSGYSDMAIGLGSIFGFSIVENFNYPYTSLSIHDFWGRWHMSLSTWFKEYVYIELGGNRINKKRTLINLFVVFLLSGIWHGANLNFIVWGIYFGVISIIERAFLLKYLEKNKIKIVNWIYMILAIMIGWVFFRSENLFEALKYIKYLFIIKGPSLDYNVLSMLNVNTWIAIIFGIALSGFVQKYFIKRFTKIINNNAYNILSRLFALFVFVLSMVLIINGSYSPSIYGKF